MIIKPNKSIENKSQLVDMAGMYIELRQAIDEKYPETSPTIRRWALEQSILRLPIKDGYDFDVDNSEVN